MANTIILKNWGERIERQAAGTITPGHLCMETSAGKLAVHNVAKAKTPAIFAVENDLEGKTIDDNYLVNTFVQASIFKSGDEVLAIVAAGAAAIVIGDNLESAGDGTLRKATAESQLTSGNYTYTSAGNVIAKAIQAVDNSGGSDPVRIKVRIV